MATDDIEMVTDDILRERLENLPSDPVAAFKVLEEIAPALAYNSACSCCDSNEESKQMMIEIFEELRPIVEKLVAK